MREALPPMDNLARALLMRGAREPALMLLKAAVRRGGDDRARCESLLMAVQARPSDGVSGPPLALDADLVEAVAAAGRLYEARAIALGADVSRNVAGVEIAAALQEIFLPVEDWPPAWRVRWQDALATGILSSMTALEREASVSSDPPPALRPRVAIALRLLRGFSLTGATHVRDPLGEVAIPILSDETRSRILARITASDLPGALRDAHAMAFEGRPGTNEVAIVLGRLINASERAMNEAPQQKMSSTVPLGGPGMALFQLRMGNLAEAQRLFRAMLADAPTDYASRELLNDLIALERALGGERRQAALPAPEPEPPARAPSTGWLDKRSRKASVEGWAASAKNKEISWEDDDDSTSVMKSDHEAELLLKAGHPDRALVLYTALVRRFPDQPRFAERKMEIEGMLAKHSTPMAMEPTVRRDVIPAVRPIGAKVDRAIDPLAQTNKDDVAPKHEPPARPVSVPPSRPLAGPSRIVPASRPRIQAQPGGPRSQPPPRANPPSEPASCVVMVRRIVPVS